MIAFTHSASDIRNDRGNRNCRLRWNVAKELCLQNKVITVINLNPLVSQVIV